MLSIYGIKNCDSVKKAIAFFKKNDLAYNFIDFTQTPVEENKIQNWLQHTDTKTLFNSRSTTYRELKLKELKLDDAQKIIWMAKENKLIKRPVVEYNDTIVVGFNEDNYKGVFL